MFTQEGITTFVIDTGLRFPQPVPMLSHDEIRAEMIRQLDAGKITGAAVAVALSIAPARVTEMRQGRRKVQQKEMPLLAQLLGMDVGPSKALHKIEGSHLIPHLGKVAQGLWLEESIIDPDSPEFVKFDREAGDPGVDDLFAVTPEGLSMNLVFPPGIKLICRRVPFTAAEVREGDLVIVERTAHDLREMTCKRVHVDDAGIYWLESESDQPQFQQPWQIGRPDIDMHHDGEISIIGKVLRGVLDYSRGR